MFFTFVRKLNIDLLKSNFSQFLELTQILQKYFDAKLRDWTTSLSGNLNLCKIKLTNIINMKWFMVKFFFKL